MDPLQTSSVASQQQRRRRPTLCQHKWHRHHRTATPFDNHHDAAIKRNETLLCANFDLSSNRQKNEANRHCSTTKVKVSAETSASSLLLSSKNSYRTDHTHLPSLLLLYHHRRRRYYYYYYFFMLVVLILASVTDRCHAYPCMLRGSSLGSSSIFLTIPESFPPRQVFTTLDQIEGDPNPLNGTIQLTLRQPNEFFAFNGPRKELTLKKALDREKMGANNRIELDILCHYIDASAQQWQEVVTPVQIVVQDVNDNAPVFLGTPYVANVSEFTQPGTVIFNKIRAIDYDATGNTVTYTIVDDPAVFALNRDTGQHFRIVDPISGIIILDKSLDYEQQQTIFVLIQAKDQGEPPMSATTTLTVNVIDADDQNPVFEHEQYRAVLPRGAKPGFELNIEPRKLYAYDMDMGINATVVYSLQHGSMNYFRINSTTGRVHLDKPIPHSGSYVLTVRATQVDNVDRFSTTSLLVKAEAPNLQPPHFANKTYQIQLPESFPVGVDVVRISAATADNETSSLKYTIVHSGCGGRSGNLFRINPKTGIIQLTQHLDYEQEQSCDVRVMASDAQGLNSTTTVHIEVLDVNDNDPEFSKPSYEFDLEEGSPVVGQVEVHDADLHDQVHLNLSSFLDVFSINDAGEIRLREPHETSALNETEYRLTVVAEDTGKPPRRNFVPVTIHVPHKNETAKAKTLIGSGGEYLILAIILGAAAAFLLMLVVCLICYVGRIKTTNDHPRNSSRPPKTSNNSSNNNNDSGNSSNGSSISSSPVNVTAPKWSRQKVGADSSEAAFRSGICNQETITIPAATPSRLHRSITAGISSDSTAASTTASPITSETDVDNNNAVPMATASQNRTEAGSKRDDSTFARWRAASRNTGSSTTTTTAKKILAGGVGLPISPSSSSASPSPIAVHLRASSSVTAAKTTKKLFTGTALDRDDNDEHDNDCEEFDSSDIGCAAAAVTSAKMYGFDSSDLVQQSSSASSSNVEQQQLEMLPPRLNLNSNNSNNNRRRNYIVSSKKQQQQPQQQTFCKTTKKLKWQDEQQQLKNDQQTNQTRPQATITAAVPAANNINNSVDVSRLTPMRFSPPYEVPPSSNNNIYYHHPISTLERGLVASSSTAAGIISAWGPEAQPVCATTVVPSGNLITCFELSALDGEHSYQNSTNMKSFSRQPNTDLECANSRNELPNAAQDEARYSLQHFPSVSSAYSSLERPADRSELTVYF